MPFITRKSLLALGVLSGAAVVAAAGFVWSGVYDIGADDRHTRPVHALLQALRERSIEVRAGKLHVPADLDDPARIRQGAGNYDAMCSGCHLGPGMPDSELSKGLYPAPPNLSRETVDAGKAFWAIKHGIKASGMPAWGKSMGDEYIWNMAAFLQALPGLDAAQYRALVAASDGHAHGGGESGGHPLAAGADAMHDDHNRADMDPADAGRAAQGNAATGTAHLHADGMRHVHAADSATTTPTKHGTSTATATTPAPAAGTTSEKDHDVHHQH